MHYETEPVLITYTGECRLGTDGNVYYSSSIADVNLGTLDAWFQFLKDAAESGFLDDLIENAYDAGYGKGYADAHSRGYDSGWDAGHDAGYAEGYAEGERTGWHGGYSEAKHEHDDRWESGV